MNGYCFFNRSKTDPEKRVTATMRNTNKNLNKLQDQKSGRRAAGASAWVTDVLTTLRHPEKWNLFVLYNKCMKKIHFKRFTEIFLGDVIGS